MRNFLSRLLKDPPPAFAFELSEAGIALARHSRPPQISFVPLDPGVIALSPLRDNILKPDDLAARVRSLVGAKESRKRHEAALILPDTSVRVIVLDFDSFPSDEQERLSLIRFRIKKGLPFDLESAVLSYHPQANARKADVVVAVAPLEVVSRYEAPFRASGLHPGLVTTSTLAALELLRDGSVSVLAKASGRVLTISVLDKGVLKLLRSIELAESSLAEVLAPLYQTFAYVEDQLGGKVEHLFICGFGAQTEELCRLLEEELGIQVERLRSRFGAPDAHNAGLLGYLEGTLSEYA